MLRTSKWVEVEIAQTGTESAEVDLGTDYQHVQVYNPALDSATITVKPSRESGDTAVQAYSFSHAATGDFVNTTTARTTAGMNVFKDICARFVTVVAGAAQASAKRTFWIRGLDTL